MMLWDTQAAVTPQGWEQRPHAQERRKSHCLGARRADQGLQLPSSGFVTVALSGVLRLFHSNPWKSGTGNSRNQLPAGRGSSLGAPVTPGAQLAAAVTQHSCTELHTRAGTRCQRDVPWAPCEEEEMV